MDTDDILESLDRGDPLSTPEVATALGISQRAAWVYLSALVDDGLVEREVGKGLRMDTWTLTGQGREAVESDGSAP